MLKSLLVLINFVGVLISVAFMVLLERKVLGYIQIRKGPNKASLLGVLQSFSDAIKLFTKEQFMPKKANFMLYYASPIFSLFSALAIWLSLPKLDVLLSWEYSALFFFSCTSLGVYSLLGSGWSANSNYSLIGAIRGVAQTVSYEASLMLAFTSLLVFGAKFSLTKVNSLLLSSVVFAPLFVIWFISMLAETNRTPFDFSEGESELVSGFNVEFSSGGFALLFLAEYAMIIFSSFLTSLIFWGDISYAFFSASFFFVFLVLWVRSCYPRFRYDKLMELSWKSFLPLVLFFLPYYILLL